MNMSWQSPIVLGESWSFLEQLEMLAQHLELSVGHPANVQLAKKLLNHFGSLPDLLKANPQQLRMVGSCDDKTISQLHLLQHLAVRLAIAKVDLHRPVLSSPHNLLSYLQAQMAGEPIEQFRVLYLNKRLHLISDNLVAKGTIDQVLFPIAHIAKDALLLNASEIIIVHNHPSGQTQPSNADLQSTKYLIEALKPLRIRVFDHIIIGKFGHMSLRSEGYFLPLFMKGNIDLENQELVQVNLAFARSDISQPLFNQAKKRPEMI